MTASADTIRPAIREALVTSFWSTPHDGDVMFDAMTTAAISAMFSGLDDVVLARMQEWLADANVVAVFREAAEAQRLRIELHHLTSTRDMIGNGLAAVVTSLAQKNAELRRELGR